MAVPWIRLIDGVLGMRDVVRVVRHRAVESAADSARAMEAPLTGVVVGALREAFNRDSERLELERLRLEDERLRAEEAMRLEVLRQAGEREISRLRLLSIVALVSLFGTLAAARLGDGSAFTRVALGAGWLCLLGALAAAFSAQAEVGRLMAGTSPQTPVTALTATPGGTAAPWLIVGGLAVIAIGALL